MKGTELCHDCAIWEKTKEKCWYFWKFKKECTQHVKNLGELPSFKKLG